MTVSQDVPQRYLADYSSHTFNPSFLTDKLKNLVIAKKSTLLLDETLPIHKTFSFCLISQSSQYHMITITISHNHCFLDFDIFSLYRLQSLFTAFLELLILSKEFTLSLLSHYITVFWMFKSLHNLISEELFTVRELDNNWGYNCIGIAYISSHHFIFQAFKYIHRIHFTISKHNITVLLYLFT